VNRIANGRKKKAVFIIKTDNKPSALDKYLQDTANFRGNMDLYANSMEVLLDDILRKIGTKPPKMFGEKIDRLRKNKRKWSRYTAKPDELLKKLTSFNADWIISKHGTSLAEPNITNITLVKDDVYYVFDKKKIEDIKKEFTQIQHSLIEIQKKLGI